MSDVTKEDLIKWFDLSDDSTGKINDNNLFELNQVLEKTRLGVFQDWANEYNIKEMEV